MDSSRFSTTNAKIITPLLHLHNNTLHSLYSLYALKYQTKITIRSKKEALHFLTSPVRLLKCTRVLSDVAYIPDRYLISLTKQTKNLVDIKQRSTDGDDCFLENKPQVLAKIFKNSRVTSIRAVHPKHLHPYRAPLKILTASLTTLALTTNASIESEPASLRKFEKLNQIDLDVYGPKINIEPLTNIIASTYYLTELNMLFSGENRSLLETTADIISSQPLIRRFSLRYYVLDPDEQEEIPKWRLLMNSLADLPNLEELRLHLDLADQHPLTSIFRMIRLIQGLKTLKFNSGQPSDQGFKEFFSTCKKLKNLKKLAFHNDNQALFKMTKDMFIGFQSSQIEELFITVYWEVFEIGFESLQAFLIQQKNLKKLSFENNVASPLQDAQLREFCNLVTLSPQLEDLSLVFSGSAENLEMVFSSLEELRSLTMHLGNAGNSGLEQVVKHLPRVRSLKVTLPFHVPNIEYKGLQEAMDLICKLKYLVNLVVVITTTGYVNVRSVGDELRRRMRWIHSVRISENCLWDYD